MERTHATFATTVALAENALSYPDDCEFAAILGATPSRGARSPTLWNAAFDAHGSTTRMLPIDVTSAQLDSLLDELDANPQFLGGAVTMPHKEAVARWLGSRMTLEAQAIGAINCLFRGSDGRLRGTNTDGEGALRSFESRFGSVRDKNVLLLGPGGAGKAVAAFFHRAVGPGGSLDIASRSGEAQAVAARLAAQAISGRSGAAQAVAARLARSQHADASETAAAPARALAWSEIEGGLGRSDVLINCTSVGAGYQVDQSPLSAEHLAKLPSHAVVFDIIYQPGPTALLSHALARGLATLDGSGMNLEQAVLAYGYAAKAPRGTDATRAAMTEARKQFN